MKNNFVNTKSELVQMSELIDSIYQGATNPAHWVNVMPKVSEWFNAPQGLLFTPQVPPEQGGFFFNHEVPDQTLQLWATKYHAEDVWVQRGIERGLVREGEVVIGLEDLIELDELKETDFYRNVLEPSGMGQLLTGLVFGMDSPPGSTVTACSWYRGINEPRFSDVERERMHLLIPHLSRAIGVMKRLSDLEIRVSSSLSALDCLSSGVLLFDAKGNVVFANTAARRILAEEDGLKLRNIVCNSSLGKLVTEHRSTQGLLSDAISDAHSPDIIETEHFSKAVRIPRPSGRQPYLLNFSSLAAHNEFGSGSDMPRAIAFVTDSDKPLHLDEHRLADAYGLTPAEIRVTQFIAEGLNTSETAAELDVTTHTARAHLKSVYAKTGTNNRARLMRLIMSLTKS